MKQYRTPARPTGTAIAALLVLSSTPLAAQVVDGAPPPLVPTVTAPSAGPAPAASPIVVPTIALPASPVQAMPTSGTPSQSSVPPPPTTKPALRTTEKVVKSPVSSVDRRQVEAENLAPVARAAAPATVPNSPDRAVARSSPTVIPQVSQSAARPMAQRDVPASFFQTAGLTLGLALIGGGGLALWLLGRRRKSAVSNAHQSTAEQEYFDVPASQTLARPTDGFSRQPLPSVADVNAPESYDRERMAAAAPSPANPFLTRKNRLRRAHFLLRQAELASVPASRAPQESVDHAPDAAARGQQVYSFASVKGANGYSLRPKAS